MIIIVIIVKTMEAPEPRRTICDMLSDCIFAIGLEAAFWIDVFRTTM